VWKNVALGLALSSLVAGLALAQEQAPRARRPASSAAHQQAQMPVPVPEPEARIVAVVNDGIITSGDLNRRVVLLLRSSGLQDSPENRQRVQERVLRTLIDEKLEAQEAKRLKVTVSKAESDGALARLEKQNNLPKGGLEKFLENLGISKSALVDQITASLLWNKLVQERLAEQVTVSDDEVKDALEEAKHAAATPQNEVAEIFLAVDNPTQDDEVKRLADKLEQQLHSGGNFAAIAQQFSQSPTAADGGSLGWISANEINPDLAKALDALKPSEVSEPIRAAGGYYILGLIDRRLPGQGNPNDTKVSVVETGAPVPPNAPVEFRQRLAQALQELAHAGSCPAFLAAAHKLGLPFVRQADDVKASTMAPSVRHITLDLQVGQISKPFPVQGGVGLVMLCARKAPPAPKMLDFAEARYAIERQHLDILARRYLSDLRRDAYVDIRG
jgi:peptidyl-prolyl cis-trans isomerase SurA